MREPYITDNPFRLVGSGSALSQQELRRKAEATSRSALVGLNTVPPLESEFGYEDIEGLVASVRSLATAPKRRTAYRIMWQRLIVTTNYSKFEKRLPRDMPLARKLLAEAE